MSDQTAARLLISGRVQGVCFRHYTNETARETGVVGWVRNRADGRVEALVQGESRAVEQVIAWCRSGPPAARVDEVQVESCPPDTTLIRFEIRY